MKLKHALTKATVCANSFSMSLATSDGELLLDYSKNIVTEDTMRLLFDLVGILHSIFKGLYL